MRTVHLPTKAFVERTKRSVEITADDSPFKKRIENKLYSLQKWWEFRQALESKLLEIGAAVRDKFTGGALPLDVPT